MTESLLRIRRPTSDRLQLRCNSSSSLLKWFATVEEVANMIVYVCSLLASGTNGAALRVDGGVVGAIV